MSCIIHIDSGVVALVVLASAYILLCFFAGGTARGWWWWGGRRGGGGWGWRWWLRLDAFWHGLDGWSSEKGLWIPCMLILLGHI